MKRISEMIIEGLKKAKPNNFKPTAAFSIFTKLTDNVLG